MRATASKKRFAMAKMCRQAFRADLTDGIALLSFQRARLRFGCTGQAQAGTYGPVTIGGGRADVAKNRFRLRRINLVSCF